MATDELFLSFPLRIDGRGRTAEADEDAHVRQLIEQLLFTAPGERVNRPGLGTGVLQAVFGPNSPEMATATEFMVQGALQQWLADRVQLEGVRVESEDATLRITVQYVVKRTRQRQVAQFSREV